MNDCLFCKIVSGEIETNMIFEDEDVIAFPDINPQAPIHILIIPKKHIPSVSEADEGDIPILGKILYRASQIARQEDIEETGYRLVINNGENAGMEVDHLHLHLLGGRKMNWPPG